MFGLKVVLAGDDDVVGAHLEDVLLLLERVGERKDLGSHGFL